MDEHDTVQNNADPQRRSFLVRLGAIVFGGLVAIFPFVAGLGVVLDPWRRGRRAAASAETGNAGAGAAEFVRICSLDALMANSPPQPFAVIADVIDGWTHAPHQRIGMVFLERSEADGKPNVAALNAKCPHLGCFVDFNASSRQFECPCHTSAFAKDGQRLFGPSLRGLDPLTVEIRSTDGRDEVFVAFQRFKPGIAEREPA